MDILRRLPCPELRRHVRWFGQRRADLTSMITAAMPARPDQFIEVYLAERYSIGRDDGPAIASPEAVVVGPQTRPGLRLHMSGTIDVFTIGFQPTGFYRLFGVPMPDIADQGIAMGELIGAHCRELVDALKAREGFDQRVQAAERWLGNRIEKNPATDMFDHATRLLAASRGRLRISLIAARSGLSARQFQRRFLTEVGTSPKFYARTLRLQAALNARIRHPERNWTAIVHEAGYADQAHFIRDCNILAGGPPGRFMAIHRP